jgi:glucose-1-phosphate cytidylyltransferase
MKVVLFCGGQGTRIRDYSDEVPKPMVPIGYRPIVWHIMKYYAYFGFKDFILCLGYQANVVKKYFMEYDESISNNFVMEDGGKEITLLNSDIDDWRITFVDTGITANIAQRLVAVRPYLDGEETFLANYSDNLTDCSIPDLIKFHQENDAIATFLSIKPFHSFHIIDAENEHGRVLKVQDTSGADFWINGGYFVLNQKIFDYIDEDDELVNEPFQKLIAESKLYTHKYEGFWATMDTFKEKQMLEDLYSKSEAPWVHEHN